MFVVVVGQLLFFVRVFLGCYFYINIIGEIRSLY